jgi:DNA modification methylase
VNVRILVGDCRDVLRTLPDESVHCVVTSPPYWGLRDYGTAKWEGGDPCCDHLAVRREHNGEKQATSAGTSRDPIRADDGCRKCGARRIDSQIGLEASYGEFVEKMVGVFAEVRRVLRADGTVWLNLGDSYATGAGAVGNRPGGGAQGDAWAGTAGRGHRGQHLPHQSGKAAPRIEAMGPMTQPNRMPQSGLKPKDLVGIPWRVAFALQADGWWLRQDIIWSKPNPMPESVTDRCTKAHEYLFLLAKGQWSRRAVKLADLSGERLHLGSNLSGSDPDTWAAKFSIGLATAILDRAKAEQNLSGTPLQAEIGEQAKRGTGGSGVECLPAIQRMATYAARLLDAQASPKEFLGEIDCVGFVLGKRGHFLIGGGDAEIALPPSIDSYGEGSIAIHDAGKIGEFDFRHGHIVAHAPSTCSYYFDAEAISEAVAVPDDRLPHGRLRTRRTISNHAASSEGTASGRSVVPNPAGGGRPGGRKPDKFDSLISGAGRSGIGEFRNTRNRRSVWTVTTQPFSEAHFATFPPALIEPCILAGCPEGGTVLDPFGGAGTTGLVADRLKRNAILIELNPAYAEMAERRLRKDAGMFAEVSA